MRKVRELIQKRYTPPREGGKKFVARLIKEARFARGLTPNEAAEAIGITRQAYYAWERGEFGNSATKLVCWLLQDHVDTNDPTYWRERCLLAERALGQMNQALKAYGGARRTLIGDDASEPSSVVPLSGMRARGQ